MGKDLARRVNERAEAQRGEVAEQQPQSIEQYIRSMEAQFALAAPRGVEAAQLVRDAITAVRRTPKLAECGRASVLGGLMTCAQLGLRPGVLGHAWLLPFWNAKDHRLDAQLVIGYQGYVDLVHRSGKVASTIARVVYANDEFDVDYGLADNLVHKPKLNGDRGDPIAYYAIGKTTTGGHSFVVVGRAEMEAHRDRFAMAKTKDGKVVGPWRDNFDEMAAKTTFLQLVKWLPKSTDLAVALAVDNSVRLDISPDADPAQVSQVVQGEVVDESPASIEGGVEPVDTGTEPGAPAENGDLVDGDQLRALNRALSDAGYRKVSDRLAFLREVTGRGDDLEATKDLTAVQAAAVLERLDAPAGGDPAPDTAPSDDVEKPDTPAPDDERSQLAVAIGKAAKAQGISMEQIEARMQQDYRTDLDHADLSDLSDLLDSLTTPDQP